MFACPGILIAGLLYAAFGFISASGQGYYDLSVEVKLSSTNIVTGQPFSFTITLSNAGPFTVSDVSISVSHEDVFYPGEEMWFLNVPPQFEGSSDFFQGRLPSLDAQSSLEFTFTAVALFSYEHHLIVGASGPDGESITGNNGQDLRLWVDLGPGLITFDTRTYFMPKNDAAVVGLRRVGGDGSPVAVFYATSNGTAIADSDYTPVQGRLEFGPGETNKTIIIPAIYDPVPGCNKSFSMHLFGGEGGIYLARHTNANVIIADRPELAGYVRPVSATWGHPSMFPSDAFSDSAVSADGQRIAFLHSELLDPYLEEWQYQLVLHDLSSRQSEPLPDLSLAGIPLLSGDGHVLAFQDSAYDSHTQTFTNFLVARRVGSDSNIMIRALGNGDYFGSLALSSNGTALAYELWSYHEYEGFGQVFVYDFITGSNEWVSVATNGAAPNGHSGLLCVDPTGRYVVFQSWASNLTSNDTNGTWDIFLRDRLTRITERISISGNGGPNAYLPSFGPARISADGRYVSFVGSRRETVPPEPLGYVTDIFVRDREAGATRRVSLEPARTQGEWFNANFADMSADGRHIVYHSFDLRFYNSATNKEIVDVYVTDMLRGETQLVSRNCRSNGGGNAPSYWPKISGDGSAIFFFSFADNLVPGEFQPGETNLFRWDRATQKISVVTANMHGAGGVAGEHGFAGVSYDGRVLAFASTATNLVFGDLDFESDTFVWTAGERPKLTIGRTGDLLTISWPRDLAPAVLESKTMDGDWTQIEEPVEVSKDENAIAIPIAREDAARFFRLRLR